MTGGMNPEGDAPPCGPAPKSRLPAELDELPNGALSMLEVGPGSDDLWNTPLLAIIRASLDRDRPVVYVKCCALGEYTSGEYLLSTIGDHRLRVVIDEDVRVFAGGEFRYVCGLPTVEAIADEVAEHEARFGPALLVLDEVELIRPYWQLAEGDEGFVPPGGPVNQSRVDRWRANDLREFAEGRSSAPTLVVSLSGVGSGRTELREVACVLASAQPVGGLAFVTLYRRSRWSDPWPVAQTANLELQPVDDDPSSSVAT